MNVDTSTAAGAASQRLDEHTRQIVQWHFQPATGCPFWLDYAAKLAFDPLVEIERFDDLKKFEPFQDEWLRGGPVRRWVPKAYQDEPVYVFETGGTTGIPKSRVAINDFRTDYSAFSTTLPNAFFPPGSNWLMLGPSGPRRLRLAVEHLAQHRGGICFCIDLDPRWVIKLIKKGWHEHLEAYKQHCIDQALTVLAAGHGIRCPPNCWRPWPWPWKIVVRASGKRASREFFPAARSSRPSGRVSVWKSCSEARPKRAAST